MLTSIQITGIIFVSLSTRREAGLWTIVVFYKSCLKTARTSLPPRWQSTPVYPEPCYLSFAKKALCNGWPRGSTFSRASSLTSFFLFPCARSIWFSPMKQRCFSMAFPTEHPLFMPLPSHPIKCRLHPCGSCARSTISSRNCLKWASVHCRRLLAILCPVTTWSAPSAM